MSPAALQLSHAAKTVVSGIAQHTQPMMNGMRAYSKKATSGARDSGRSFRGSVLAVALSNHGWQSTEGLTARQTPAAHGPPKPDGHQSWVRLPFPASRALISAS